MMIAERMSTLRVSVVAASLQVRSHAVATSILKRQVSGAFDSEPPTRPVASSLALSVNSKNLIPRGVVGFEG